MIIELAAFAPNNTFGVYDVTDPTKHVALFDGTDSVGSQVVFGVKDDGSILVNFADSGIDSAGNNFGYFLDSPDGLFHSQTDLNGDGFDHMVAYAGNGDQVKIGDLAAGTFGPGEYILAWEDIYG